MTQPLHLKAYAKVNLVLDDLEGGKTVTTKSE